MTFSYTFDNPTLFLVLYQYVSKKASVIHKYSKIPQSTIYRYIQEIERNVNILEQQKGQGRKDSIPEPVKKKIVRTARRRPLSSSARSLANQYDVGKSSVDRILLDNNYTYGSVKVKKTLTDEEKRNRVDFCKDMIKYKDSKLMMTFYSDETGINLSQAHRNKAWNPPRKPVTVDFIKRDVRVNCWGAISSRGATSLHIFKKSLKMDRYRAILLEHKQEMDYLYPRGYYMQQDNLSVHKYSKDWLEGQGFDILDFPTYSPDLSPIENLWDYLKDAVGKENPKTEIALRDSLMRNWAILTTREKLQHFFKNFHNRYIECIQKNGEALNH